MNRLASLDWLRGMLALSIMIYHLVCWEIGQPGAGTFLGRMGIYGVSMFFILSGLSMAVGYTGYVRDLRSSVRFLVRRAFRIWPLLWLAVAVVTAGERVFNGRVIDWSLVLLNVTTLFGFVSPGSYINTGAWSIGNEMVYYTITPMLLALYDRSTKRGNIVALTLVTLSLAYGFWRLDARSSLAGQWLQYIFPATNLFLYLSGVWLYYNTRNLEISAPIGLSLILAAIVMFSSFPGSGDLIGVVTGFPRLVFALAAIILVFSFYKTPISLPTWLSRPLGALGVATYGVYLLHPIAYQVVKLIARHLGVHPGPLPVIGLTMLVTITCASVIYRRFESSFIALGKRLTSRPTLAGRVA